MRQETYDVIAWGRVVVDGESFFLLAPKPYHSEVKDGGVSHSVWQPQGTLKWEVAKANEWDNYERSILVFGTNALIEFYQDPKTIKVLYVIPDEDDDDNVAVAPTN